MKSPTFDELAQIISEHWAVLITSLIFVSAVGVPLLNLIYRNRLAEKDAEIRRLEGEKSGLEKKVTVIETGGVSSLPSAHLDKNQTLLESVGPKTSEVQWFVERGKATDSMKEDVARFEEVVFVGVSHTKLSTYLEFIVNDSDSGELPWSTVTVYFASDEIGELYEGVQFHENMRRSRLDLAVLFTGNSMRRSSVNPTPTIRFRQRTTAAHFDGVLMKNVGDSEPRVAYVVQAVPRAQGDTTKAVTYRASREDMSATSPILDRIIAGLSEIHEVVSSDYRDLGSFSVSNWDKSVDSWHTLDKQSSLNKADFQIVMDYIETLEVQQHVIDAACGCGNEIPKLVTSGLAKSIVALDGSPQMVFKLKKSISEEENVRFALCSLPESAKDSDYTGLDVGEELASLIIVHNSIHSICPYNEDLLSMAMWCSRRTLDDGSVIVSGHNGIFELPKPVDGEYKEDIFREKLEMKCKLRFPEAFIPSSDRPKLISPDEVKDAFSKAGFQEQESKDKLFDISMNDRRLLWRVPAVASSIVELSRITMSDFCELVEDVAAGMEYEKTMPRTVRTLHFRKTKKSEMQGKTVR